jgi:uncharacterized membrane protein
MRGVVAVPLALLAGGAAAIGVAVATGGAQVALLLFVPVLVGSSALFALGIGLLVVGFFVLPFALMVTRDAAPGPESPPGLESAPGVPAGGSGGFVLIGPVPIVWGSWAHISRRVRIALAATGALVLAVAVIVALVALR